MNDKDTEDIPLPEVPSSLPDLLESSGVKDAINTLCDLAGIERL